MPAARPNLDLGRHSFVPDPTGALLWPVRSTLFVADLHFGKGAAYARRGSLLPPYDTRATLVKLAALLDRFDPDRVVCLGDSFHDRFAIAEIDGRDRATIRRLADTRDWVWVAGNHDPDPPHDLGGRVVDELVLDDVVCRHEARADARSLEISGHFHPAASVEANGGSVTRPCFVSDGQRIILPAFGAYAGGLNALDTAFEPLFPGGFTAYVLGRSTVHEVRPDRLRPPPERRADT